MKRKVILPLIVILLIVSFALSTVFGLFKNVGEKVVPPPVDLKLPPILGHSIEAVIPHDTSFYTQGITFYKGELYEGTGDPGYLGKTRLMKLDLKTGRPLKQISVEKKYFGEGITILRDTIYQLTWQENKVFAYTVKDFKKVKEYHLPTEGWGLTNDGQRLIVSTGSGMLYYYDPSTFKLLSKTSIMEGNAETFNLNELEFIDGFIYANQYQLAYILKIDPAAARVVAKYDVSDMWKRVQAAKPDADYPNGIAYDEVTKKIYVTGKLWPEMYEIKLGQ
jgi:glutamine cyclotransferase